MKFVDVVVNIPTANAIERLCHRSCGGSPFAGSTQAVSTVDGTCPAAVIEPKERGKKNKLGRLTKQVILPNRKKY